MKDNQLFFRPTLAATIYSVLIIVVGLTLFIMHGFEEYLLFKIDYISIILLVFAFLPFIGIFIEKVKAGKFTLSFGKESVPTRLLSIIREVSKLKLLTFYEPRDYESPLDDAFRYLVKELKDRHEMKLIKELKFWLRDEDENIKWIATEIIGYYDLKMFNKNLVRRIENKDVNVPWKEWRLNCVWAHSKMENNNFKEVTDMLMETKHPFNQKWLIDVYVQMPREKHGDPVIFIKYLRDFLKRNDLTHEVIEHATTSIKKLEKYLS